MTLTTKITRLIEDFDLSDVLSALAMRVAKTSSARIGIKIEAIAAEVRMTESTGREGEGDEDEDDDADDDDEDGDDDADDDDEASKDMAAIF